MFPVADSAAEGGAGDRFDGEAAGMVIATATGLGRERIRSGCRAGRHNGDQFAVRLRERDLRACGMIRAWSALSVQRAESRLLVASLTALSTIGPRLMKTTKGC